MSAALRPRLHGKTDDLASCGISPRSFHPGHKAASLISVTAGRHEEGEVCATRLLLGTLANEPLDFIPVCRIPLSGKPRIGVFMVTRTTVFRAAPQRRGSLRLRSSRLRNALERRIPRENVDGSSSCEAFLIRSELLK